MNACIPLAPAENADAALPAWSFVLNGQPVSVHCVPDQRLLSLLREHFMLAGAKPGCEVGRCGACMVWLDGQPVNSCLLMAWQLEGRQVTTIEGLPSSAHSARVVDALAQCGGVQCGYCSAGMCMGLTYLHQQPGMDAPTASALMCGHLCRCTGYGGIRRAIDALFPAPGQRNSAGIS